MKGCMSRRVIRSPCASPISTPSASISTAAAGQGTAKLTIRSTKSTPSSAITEPTESSMPPVMMTKPWPMAKRPKRPTRFAVLARFIGEMKRGLMKATTAPTTRIRTRSPKSFFCIYASSSPRMSHGQLQHPVLGELRPRPGCR